MLDQILAKGYVARGWLGAAMQPVDSDAMRTRAGMTEDGGLVILSVEPDAPAALAGPDGGRRDRLPSTGNPVTRTDQVLELLAGDVVGKTLTVELVRGGKPERVELLVGERPRNRR